MGTLRIALCPDPCTVARRAQTEFVPLISHARPAHFHLPVLVERRLRKRTPTGNHVPDRAGRRSLFEISAQPS